MPFLSKILEKVVPGLINEHFLIYKLHDKFRFEYRTSFSSDIAFIKITDDNLYVLDNKSFIALIMIDMSAAQLSNWVTLNKLKLNPNKIQCMVFSCKQSVFNVLDDDESLVMSHNSAKKSRRYS